MVQFIPSYVLSMWLEVHRLSTAGNCPILASWHECNIKKTSGPDHKIRETRRQYSSTLADSTLISELLKFSEIISSKSKNIVKDNSEYLRKFSFVEMKISKLINYSTDMCWNGQATTVLTNQTKGHFTQEWNPAFQLVESFKLVLRLLEKGLGLGQIKLWFSLHGIILEGKSIGPNEKKELQGEFMVWRTKVQGRVQGYSFFQFLFFFIVFLTLVQIFWKWKNVTDWEHCWEQKSSPF
jgi:hypothetical protein